MVRRKRKKNQVANSYWDLFQKGWKDKKCDSCREIITLDNICFRCYIKEVMLRLGYKIHINSKWYRRAEKEFIVYTRARYYAISRGFNKPSDPLEDLRGVLMITRFVSKTHTRSDPERIYRKMVKVVEEIDRRAVKLYEKKYRSDRQVGSKRMAGSSDG